MARLLLLRLPRRDGVFEAVVGRPILEEMQVVFAWGLLALRCGLFVDNIMLEADGQTMKRLLYILPRLGRALKKRDLQRLG